MPCELYIHTFIHIYVYVYVCVYACNEMYIFYLCIIFIQCAMNNRVVEVPLNPSIQCAGFETVVFKHNLKNVMNACVQNVHTCDMLWTLVTLLNCLYRSTGASNHQKPACNHISTSGKGSEFPRQCSCEVN